MDTIAINNLLIILSFFLIMINYVVAAMALFKISKLESVSKPWFAWIPVLSDYLVIKLGKGSKWFVILALVSFLLGGVELGLGQSDFVRAISLVITSLWVSYKLLMYRSLCSKYEVSTIIFVIGFLGQLIGQISILVLAVVVTILGHILLYRSAANWIKEKPIIETKVVFTKNKKKK